MQSDGKIVAAGVTQPTEFDPRDIAVARYESSGAGCTVNCDSDGIGDDEEDGVDGNGDGTPDGDGNQDGVADALQPRVASFRNAVD